MRFLLLVIVALIGTNVILFLTRPGNTFGGGTTSRASNEDATNLFSSYSVIFPTQGTSSEKVKLALQEVYPKQFEEIRLSTSARNKMLREKADDLVRKLKSPEKMKELSE